MNTLRYIMPQSNFVMHKETYQIGPALVKTEIII